MAAPREFRDRRDRLFGRKDDVSALTERLQIKGLTAVAARPLMGKSWLLEELARHIAVDRKPRALVGIAESSGEGADLLLRAVVDLYARWLSDSDFLEQARMTWDQQKPNLLPSVAGAVGRILMKTGEAVAKPIAAVVEEALKGLIAANNTLTTGGVLLPVLQYDQARDLVAAVAAIAERPIVLILDQWEKSPDPEFEAKTLDAFLHHLDEWPNCHIFVALRPDEPAFAIVERLVAGRPGPAQLYQLEPMALEESAEHERLVRFIQKSVSGADGEDGETLLSLIDGYPGVIYQWSNLAYPVVTHTY